MDILQNRYDIVAAGIQDNWPIPSDEWVNYVRGLSPELRIAYLVRNFDEHMFNGGFFTLFTNEFACFCYDLVRCLHFIGAHASAMILEEAIYTVNEDDLPKAEFADALQYELIDIFDNLEIEEILYEVDDAYLASEENVLELLNELLRQVSYN